MILAKTSPGPFRIGGIFLRQFITVLNESPTYWIAKGTYLDLFNNSNCSRVRLDVTKSQDGWIPIPFSQVIYLESKDKKHLCTRKVHPHKKDVDMAIR
jgi:hypothetical protein